MKKKLIVCFSLLLVLSLTLYFILLFRYPSLENMATMERLPSLYPDYTQIVIPPNMAPLNFIVKEDSGVQYYVRIHSKNERAISILNEDPEIKIPLKKWKKLLNNNRGEDLFIDVCVKRHGTWKKFKPVINKIAMEEIDGYLVYRLINPGYRLWKKMGIYMRNLQNFEEDPIIVNDLTNKSCMNCHSFSKNNPNKALFHVRGNLGGTILVEEGKVKKINMKTDYTLSPGVYPAWHPDGKRIAFSVNRIAQQFYSAGPKSITVFDKASDIILYDTKRNLITTSSALSTDAFENMPAWSPDGKFLYYCSAPKPDSGHAVDSVKYSLLRIAYNAESNAWGKVDTVLSSEKTGLSLSWPRVSPDGRFLMFSMSDYGYFTVYNPSSDLYLMDLKTGEYRYLSINSNDVESYHSWSSNGRWFVFSSKRRNGLFSRPYFSYFDKDGKNYKAFIMPQEDPAFYDTFLKNYNIPELLTSRWNVSKWEWYKTIQGDASQVDVEKTEDHIPKAAVSPSQEKGNEN